MNYADTLKYLYSKLPMYQRIGATAFKKDLGNIVAFLDALNHPERAYPAIHIAGTNGKGSVSSMLASVLKAAGYRVGLYTSPHLRNFTERIRVDGEEMPQEAVIAFVEAQREVIEAISPSFFEVTVAMAFSYFKTANVDVAVIETGLGGRLDSTNVLQPKLGVITNISYDHAPFLGETLPEIAGEKAGIIKPGMKVVLGEPRPDTLPVFQAKATEVGAELIVAPEVFVAQPLTQDLEGQQFAVRRQDGTEMQVRLDLAGHYQAANLVTALSAIEVLRQQSWELSQAAVLEGLAAVRRNAGLRGRMEVLAENPLVLADVGHNEAGVAAIAAQIAGVPHRHLHMVWGAVKDKDVRKILAMLPKDARYYFVKADVPRGLDAEALAEVAGELGLQGQVFGSVAAGLAAAKEAASADDLVFVGGSTFVVAEVV